MDENEKKCDALHIYPKNFHKSSEEKVDDLKKALKTLGYEIEETPEGIKVTSSSSK